MGSTIASQWDLVCSDEFLLGVGQTVYFLGMTLGVFMAGILSDRFGRKKVIIGLILKVSACGLVTAAAPNFESFLIARFFTALGAIGIILLYRVSTRKVRPLPEVPGVPKENVNTSLPPPLLSFHCSLSILAMSMTIIFYKSIGLMVVIRCC